MYTVWLQKILAKLSIASFNCTLKDISLKAKLVAHRVSRFVK